MKRNVCIHQYKNSGDDLDWHFGNLKDALNLTFFFKFDFLAIAKIQLKFLSTSKCTSLIAINTARVLLIARHTLTLINHVAIMPKEKAVVTFIFLTGIRFS